MFGCKLILRISVEEIENQRLTLVEMIRENEKSFIVEHDCTD